MRHLITVLILIGACVFYLIGFGAGLVAALVAAAGLELWFWVRMVRHRRGVRGAERI